jgi:hypothetical protein
VSLSVEPPFKVFEILEENCTLKFTESVVPFISKIPLIVGVAVFTEVSSGLKVDLFFKEPFKRISKN